MIPPETLFVFFMASAALALAPGPDNIFVLTQSMLHGPRAGLLVTVGLCTGLLAHTAAVALGVAAVFETSATAFNVLKVLGAGYLLYLAWLSFKAGTSDISSTEQNVLRPAQLYRRGIIMNITNPKVAIFFLAFLPQFAAPANGSITLQIMLLGVVFIVAALLVFGSISWGAGFLGGRLRRSPRSQIMMNRLAGTVFAALAVRLVTAER